MSPASRTTTTAKARRRHVSSIRSDSTTYRSKPPFFRHVAVLIASALTVSAFFLTRMDWDIDALSESTMWISRFGSMSRAIWAL